MTDTIEIAPPGAEEIARAAVEAGVRALGLRPLLVGAMAFFAVWTPLVLWWLAAHGLFGALGAGSILLLVAAPALAAGAAALAHGAATVSAMIPVVAAHLSSTGPRTLRLGPDGILSRDETSFLRVRWDALTTIVERPEGVDLIYLDASAVFGVVPIADAELPAGLSRADLLARIAAWRDA